jgi:hypothetical protein
VATSQIRSASGQATSLFLYECIDIYNREDFNQKLRANSNFGFVKNDLLAYLGTINK